MKKLVIALLAVMGILAVLAVVSVVAFVTIAAGSKQRVPRSVILEVDFEQGVVEAVPDDPIGQAMMEDVTELRDILDALERGAGDKRVKALVARIGGGGMGLAHLQEIRDAVIRFRESGKPAIAFSETFGEFGPGNGGYYLATAFDEIHLQPSGDIGITGMIYESPFIRGLLDKLEVEPRMGQRHEYKNAMNFYTHKEYTAAHREAMQDLMDSQFSQIVRGIAEARQMTEEQVVRLFDAAPYLGQEALEAGLVDGLGYRDEVYEHVRELAGGNAKLLFLKRYIERSGRPNTKGETIALIHGYGGVNRGESSYSPLNGSVSVGPDTVSRAFRAAVRDDRVKAIVFRVDCPGGSYVASDTIWRETRRAQEAGKPVIATMGNVAGSGGYFVLMDADKIVAQPGTITASIGVLGGKMITTELWDKFGVSFDDVHTGEHSTMWSGNYEYGAAEERFEASLDRIYADFTGKVAAARDLPLERVQEIAKGRIWTGEDALKLGLVDELGGLDTALMLAREAIGVEPDAPVKIKRFPKRRSGLELLFGNRSPNSERATLLALRRSIEAIQPYAKALQRLGVLEQPGVLSMPPVAVEP